MSQLTTRVTVNASDAVSTTKTVAHGLSRVPQVVIAYGFRVASAATRESYEKTFGAAVKAPGDSVITQYSTGTHSDDNVSTSQSDVVARNDCIVCEIPTGAAPSGTAGKLQVTSIDGTNVIFTVTEQFTFDMTVQLMIIAGDDLTWVELAEYSGAVATGNISFTNVNAFKPDFILFFGHHLSQSAPFLGADSTTFIGAADKNGNQWTWAGGINDAGGGASGGGGRCVSYMLSGHCLANIQTDASQLNCQASLVSMDNTGFTLNYDVMNLSSGQTTGRRFYALMIQGAQFQVGNFNTFTDTNPHDIATSFSPEQVMFASANKVASVSPTLDVAERLSLGYATNVVGYWGQKGIVWSPSTVVIQDGSASLCYLNDDNTPARISTASASMGASKFTWTHGTADVANNFVGFIAYATQAPAGALTTVVKTVKPNGGGDYTSLNSGLIGELAAHKNMVTQNIILEFDCYAGIDTTAVVVPGFNNSGNQGYITGPANYIFVKAIDGHAGKLITDGTKYLLDINANGGKTAFSIKCENVRCRQLQLRTTVSDGSGADGFKPQPIGMLAPTRWEYINCISKAVLTNGSTCELFNTPSTSFAVAGVKSYYINCIAMDGLCQDQTMFGFGAPTGVTTPTVVRYNCLAVNCAFGFHDQNYVIDKNNVAYGNDNGWNTSDGPNAASTNNISTNGPTGAGGTFLPGIATTGTLDAKGTNATNGQIIVLTDALNNDFRPVAGVDVQLIGTGVDLSADATYPFNFDIANNTRSGVWTRGPFHVATGATQQLWLWSLTGQLTTSSTDVICKYNKSENITIQYGTDPTFAAFSSSTVAADAFGYAKFSLASLTKTTVYYYRTSAASAPTVFSPVYKFTTLGATSFKIVCGGCSASGTNTNLYNAYLAEQPLMYVQYGDLHYWNITSYDQGLYRRAQDHAWMMPKRSNLMRNVPLAYVWDDHDFGGDNSDSTSLAKLASQTEYRRGIPHYTLPGTSQLPLIQAQTIIFVKNANRYGYKRGLVTFYNWASAATVNVDVSTVLANGDAYSIYDVRDLATPVLSGTYAGGTLGFPTTQKPDPTPIGGFVSNPTDTAPFFNAFLIVGPNPTPTFDYYVSPAGGNGAGTIGDPWSLSYAMSGAGGKVVAGKRIALRDGSYDTGASPITFTKNGVIGSATDAPDGKIIWQAYQSEKPIIKNRSSSSAAGDAITFNCDYNWFIGLEFYDDGWASRDVSPSGSGGLTIPANKGNGVKLIHCTVHDFEQNIQTADGTSVPTDKFEVYGSVVYNGGVNRGAAGHNFFVRHTGSVAGVISIDTNVIFNAFGMNVQNFSNSLHSDYLTITNNIAFNAGGLDGAPGTGQYQFPNFSIGGTSLSSHNIIITNNMIYNDPSGRALIVLGGNTTDNQSNIEIGSNYGVGGGASSGQFSTFAIRAPSSPQNSMYIHDNLFQTTGSDILAVVTDAGTLGYIWTNNEWHHPAASGWDGTTYANWKSTSGLGSTDIQSDSNPGTATQLDVGPIYQSFVIGRFRCILTDLRSEKTPSGNVDNATKTMMGATQKAWFKNELLTAASLNQFILWFGTVPWNAPPTDQNDDWKGYQTEKAELLAFIQAHNLQKQMIMCNGDMHSAAIDDGTHNSGIPILLPFPENQTTQVYTGSYTQGPLAHNGVRLMGMGGVISVTDTGTGSTAQVTLRVINELGTLFTLPVTLTLSAPSKIFITHVIDVINFSAFPESNKGPNA